MTELVLIGVPYWLGLKNEYTGSVETIRDAGIAEMLDALWVDVEPDLSATDPVNAVNRGIAAAMNAYPNRFPLVLAGDCTTCIGAVKGLERHSPHVLWYDAHGDFNTPETTPSNFLGGMPLAAMVGMGNQYLMEGVGLKPLAEDTITITDARDLDPPEAELLKASQLRHLPDVQEVKSLDWVDTPLYVHFDCDVVDTSEMPAMGYPAPGGPTTDVAIESLLHALTHSRPVGVLFSLYNASMPGAEHTRDNIVRVIRAAGDTLKKL